MVVFSHRQLGKQLDPGFEEFVLDRSAALLRTAFLLTGDRGHAEDLLQTALLRTALKWRRASSANPEAYVRQVLVNLARDRWRRLKRRVAEQSVDDLPMAPASHRDHADVVADRAVILHALAVLPQRQREVVVLRFFCDFDGRLALDLSLNYDTRQSIAADYSDNTYQRVTMTLRKGQHSPINPTTSDTVRKAIRTGTLTVAGDGGTVNGQPTVLLISHNSGLWPDNTKLWVNASSYLPVRYSFAMSSKDRVGISSGTPVERTADITYLPPTPANLALLVTPVPAGFTPFPGR